jgi:cytochrome c5
MQGPRGFCRRIAKDEEFEKTILVASLLMIAGVFGACGDNSIDTGDSGGAMFPIEVTDARVSAGEGVYSQNCASCHGPVNGPATLPTAPVHGDAGHT